MGTTRVKTDLELGFNDKRHKSSIALTEKSRKVHMHVIGATGKGKSYFIEHLIRQDIKGKRGLCLIDPHGTLYDHILWWCMYWAERRPAFKEFINEKLTLIEPANPYWSFGFNPLFVPEPKNGTSSMRHNSIAYYAANLRQTFGTAWGDEDFSATPLLRNNLPAVFSVLAENNRTLYEAPFLTSAIKEDIKIRKHLTSTLSDKFLQRTWQGINALSIPRFNEAFSSTNNRLAAFLAPPVVRRMLGLQKNVINFRRLMDDQHIVLINLGTGDPPQLSGDDAKIIGSLLTTDIFLKAQERPENSPPFYLYIDECGEYLNKYVERMFNESRKRALHLILAHQTFSQLQKAGDTVYRAVRANAQTKIIFGGIDACDADICVDDTFMDISLEEEKFSLRRTAVVGTEKIKTLTEGQTSAIGSAASTGVGTSINPAEAGFFQEPTTLTNQEGTADSSTEATSYVVGEAHIPVFEEVVGGVFTLEEQKYRLRTRLMQCPPQHALVRFPDYQFYRIRVNRLENRTVSENDLNQFKERRFKNTPFAIPVEEADKEIKERLAKLSQDAGVVKVAPNSEPPDPATDFGPAPATQRKTSPNPADIGEK